MKDLHKTRVPNLWRHKNGTFYAVQKVKGKAWPISKSLGVSKETIARLRLPAKLAEIRASAGRLNSASLTIAECIAVYRARLRDRGYARKNHAFKMHKPRSLDYRAETISALEEHWLGFGTRHAATITPEDCHTIANKLRRTYSPSRYNGIVQTLRGILQIAVENASLTANPAATLGLMHVEPSRKFIPTRDQFTEILRLLDFAPTRRHARLSIRAMAFTGLRPNEARHLAPSDINLPDRKLTARETKNGKPRDIQLIDQAVDFFEQETVPKILRALKKSPRRAMATIARQLKLPGLTPYTMRHLFLTSLIESGVDIGVAADIAGHQDRGATLLRHYHHIRADHLRAQLKKVIV